MTSPISVEQAIFVRTGDDIHERGSSPGLAEIPNWRADAERLCRGFGPRPEDSSCPLALFAQPFGPRHVAVVQVSDSVGNQLTFRFLILPRAEFAQWIRDPFAVSDRFSTDWSSTGALATLEWHAEPPPRRTIAQLQNVLETGGSPTLLGTTQALVDGGRVVFERAAPTPELVRNVWSLLPDANRAELWPATFAFSNDLRFDLLVVPKTAEVAVDRYVTEEQTVDYPEGQFEFRLQYAVEHGDQREIDHLLSRRSSKQMLRLLIFVIIGGFIIYTAASLLLNLL